MAGSVNEAAVAGENGFIWPVFKVWIEVDPTVYGGNATGTLRSSCSSVVPDPLPSGLPGRNYAILREPCGTRTHDPLIKSLVR